jgi:hypothetical protein
VSGKFAGWAGVFKDIRAVFRNAMARPNADRERLQGTRQSRRYVSRETSSQRIRFEGVTI